jgi:hypothetical protein
LWTVKPLWRQASICPASGGRITSSSDKETEHLAAQPLGNKRFRDPRQRNETSDDSQRCWPPGQKATQQVHEPRDDDLLEL